MKFTIFLLYTGFCLAKVSGSAVVNSEDVENYDYITKDFADESKQIEPRGAFSGMSIVFKKALKTVKGLKCTNNEVSAIQSGALSFIDQVNDCGTGASKKVEKIFNATANVVLACVQTFGINERICGYTISDEDKSVAVIENAKPAKDCSSQMFKKLQTLKKQIRNALKLIQQAEKTHKSSECEMMAVSNLNSYLTEFPDAMKNCSERIDKFEL